MSINKEHFSELDYLPSERVNNIIDSIAELEETNIENGNGQNSIQQPLDAESWNSTNELVKEHIANKATNVNGHKIETIGSAIKVTTIGKNASMWGGKSQALGGKSHAEGSKTIAFENNTHAEGNETFAVGQHSHAEGNTTTSIGNAAHSEGILTVAVGNNSHAEGGYTTANGAAAHSEGHKTQAVADYTHAEGFYSEAKGQFAHAEGHKTTAEGFYSHSEGNDTHAIGGASHASGQGTYADDNHCFVIGRYNERDVNESGVPRQHCAFIIGNGTDNDNRSNSCVIDWDGNAYFAGDIILGLDQISLIECIAGLEKRISELESKLN